MDLNIKFSILELEELIISNGRLIHEVRERKRNLQSVLDEKLKLKQLDVTQLKRPISKVYIDLLSKQINYHAARLDRLENINKKLTKILDNTK